MANNYPNPKLRIALLEPQIPQNTGNIARTSAAFKIPLDIIGPIGFSLDDKYLKRAGLDYWPYVDVKYFDNLNMYLASLQGFNRLIATSKKDGILLYNFKFMNGDILLFGREDSGIPQDVKNKCNSLITIPMPGSANAQGTGGVRSLNLAVATGIVTYQAAIQLKFHL